MLKVICFYWLGDRWKDDGLGPTYINKLYNGVKRNLEQPFDFFCFTNELITSQIDPEIVVRPIRKMPTNKGVLPRLYMFSRQAGLFGHQVLAIDLDVVITGDLSDIANYDGEFCARSKFAPGQKFKLDGDMMSFQAGKTNEKRLWEPYAEDPDKVLQITGGRERYWYREVFGVKGADRWDKVAPGQMVSYKRHVRTNNNQLPEDARIVSCHGEPRPHETKFKWVVENWV